jgi:type I restriction enzyme, S subunit
MSDAITNAMDIWTSAIGPAAGGARSGKREAYGIKKLRELILKLAVRGKLVPQDSSDEPASLLLERVIKQLAQHPQKRLARSRDDLRVVTGDMPFALPPGWVAARNDSLFALRKGKKPRTVSELPSGLPYLDIEALDRGNIVRFTDDETCPRATDEDILVVCDGSRSGLILDGKNGVVGSTLAVIDTPRMIQPFVRLLFMEAYERLNSTMKGAAIPHLDTGRLMRAVVGLPPLNEQRRIVAKVHELTGLCDRLEQQQSRSSEAHDNLVEVLLATLANGGAPQALAHAWSRIATNFDALVINESSIEQLKEAILQLAVQGKLVPQNPSDEPASLLLARILESREQLIRNGRAKRGAKLAGIIPEDTPFALPPGWVWTRFEDLINPEFPLSYGVLVPGPDVENGVPLVRIEDLDIKNPRERPSKSIAKDIDANYDRTRLMGGEILMGVVGSIGKLGIAPPSWKGANIARAVCRIKPTDLVKKGFVVWLLQSELMRGRFVGDTRTLAQPTLNIGLIRSALTPLPPSAEQHRIVDKLEELMALCDALKARIAEARTSQLHLADAVLEQAVA